MIETVNCINHFLFIYFFWFLKNIEIFQPFSVLTQWTIVASFLCNKSLQTMIYSSARPVITRTVVSPVENAVEFYIFFKPGLISPTNQRSYNGVLYYQSNHAAYWRFHKDYNNIIEQRKLLQQNILDTFMSWIANFHQCSKIFFFLLLKWFSFGIVSCLLWRTE